MNDQLLVAMETYGLVGAEGEGSEADILTDIQEMLEVPLPIVGFTREHFKSEVIRRQLVEAGHLALQPLFCSTGSATVPFPSNDSYVPSLPPNAPAPSQTFKPGKPLKFTCTFDAKPKPENDDAPVEDATSTDTA